MTLGGRAWPWKTGRVGMSMVRFLLPQRGKDSPGQVRRLGKIRTGAVAVTVVCPVTTQGRDAWRLSLVLHSNSRKLHLVKLHILEFIKARLKRDKISLTPPRVRKLKYQGW